MKKLLKLTQLLALSLCFLLLASSVGQALEIQPYYTDISKLIVTFSISSGGTATCGGKVLPQGAAAKTSKIIVKLQQKNGDHWITLDSWSETGAGVAGASCSETRSVDHGTYRVAATGRVYDAAGALLESATKYSAEVTY